MAVTVGSAAVWGQCRGMGGQFDATDAPLECLLQFLADVESQPIDEHDTSSGWNVIQAAGFAAGERLS